MYEKLENFLPMDILPLVQMERYKWKDEADEYKPTDGYEMPLWNVASTRLMGQSLYPAEIQSFSFLILFLKLAMITDDKENI